MGSVYAFAGVAGTVDLTSSAGRLFAIQASGATAGSRPMPTATPVSNAAAGGTPTALRATTALSSRTPQPAKLIGSAAAKLTTTLAAARSTIGTSEASPCAIST